MPTTASIMGLRQVSIASGSCWNTPLEWTQTIAPALALRGAVRIERKAAVTGEGRGVRGEQADGDRGSGGRSAGCILRSE